jgi:hypothetical protein
MFQKYDVNRRIFKREYKDSLKAHWASPLLGVAAFEGTAVQSRVLCAEMGRGPYAALRNSNKGSTSSQYETFTCWSNT